MATLPDSVEVSPPAWLASTAAVAWRLLVLAAAAYLALILLNELQVIVIPSAAALLLSTLLAPPARWLSRRGVPVSVAATIVTAIAIGAVLALLVFLLPPLVRETAALSSVLRDSAEQIRGWLIDGPFHLSEAQVDAYVSEFEAELSRNTGRLIQRAVGSAAFALEAVVSALLTIVLTFFFVKDGEKTIDGAINLLSEERAAHARHLRQRIWLVLSNYVRGTATNGAVNALAMSLGLLVIGVPLIFPIAIVTLLGAFFPLIGTFVAGALAAMVAMASKGIGAALLVIVLTAVVHNLEGYLVGPFVLGRALRLSPPVILVAIAAGTVSAGLSGAVLAVPLAAITFTVFEYSLEQRRAAPPRTSGNSPPVV